MMRKHYTPTFKAQVVRELLKEDKTLAQLAAEHGVHPTQLIKWRATALEGLPSLFTRQDSTAALTADYEGRLAALYEEIGRLTTQVAWLKRKSGLEPLQR
jgi:transposase-like protein